MNLPRQSRLILILLLLYLAVGACSSARRGGMSPPKKKRKKCDCPKWTHTPGSLPPHTYRYKTTHG
ncbi:MAG TPA: hypothetical protein P5531_06680 [Bacteroidales bacterium]|nr:hypothetical protein [Bacteroidales bacterium]HSA43677.1 hypothetical protein [Bacteroidales bacterium]